MAIPGQIIEYDWTWSGNTYKMFAKDGQLDTLLEGISPQDSVNRAPVTMQVSGHTRKRYPGGPNISVGGFSRTSLVGAPGNRRTLPGQNAYLEVTTGEGVERQTDVTTITFTGPYTELYQFVLANALVEMVLRSPDGTADSITLAGP